MLLADDFGLRVAGLDLSAANVALAQSKATAAGLAERVSFTVGDAERLPYADAAFDAVVVECALSTFSNKAAAASEMARVLRPGGKLGVTDVVADPARLPADLTTLAARIACVADALPLRGYADLLRDAGLRTTHTERHDSGARMIDQIEARLAVIRMTSPARLEQIGIDIDRAGLALSAARAAVADGILGYGARPRGEVDMLTSARRCSASRAATNELLAELRTGRWRPRAWGRFIGRAAVLSWTAAQHRPRAVAEIAAVHAALAALSRGKRRTSSGYWVAISWALSTTHLGLLESNRSLGVANIMTLLRANLPAMRPRDGRLCAAAALASDLVDGRLARWRHTATPFGQYADSIADAVFWTWFAFRHETDPRMRLLALGSWTIPAVTVMVTSVAGGRMVDAPRPVVARPAALMQIVLTIRALSRPGTTQRPVAVR
jgi:hypothetical protein